MPLIPRLMWKVVRDRVHHPPRLMGGVGGEERGGWIACGRERRMWPTGIWLGWCLWLPGSWLDFKSLGFGIFLCNLLLALCFSIQLHAEAFLCDNVGYQGLLDVSWVINLSFDTQSRIVGNNLPSVRCLALSRLDSRKNSNKTAPSQL